MRFPVNIPSLRLPRIIGLLALAVLLNACSAIKIAYNQAPELAYWYLDGYVDFNGNQMVQVKDELTRLQTWHRQSQLPVYVNALQKYRQELANNTSSERVCSVYAEVRRTLMAVPERAEPAIASLAATIDTQQIAHLEKRFEKGNAEYRDDHIDSGSKASRKKRYKQSVDRAEMLYGRLDDEQLALIGKNTDQSHFDARVFYAERIRRQRDAVHQLQALVAARQGGTQTAEKTKAAVRGVMERTFNSPDAAYRDHLQRFTQDGCRSVAELHNTTTAEQRAHAAKTLAKRRFTRLICFGTATLLARLEFTRTAALLLLPVNHPGRLLLDSRAYCRNAVHVLSPSPSRPAARKQPDRNWKKKIKSSAW